jgi:hypothetical protein
MLKKWLSNILTLLQISFAAKVQLTEIKFITGKLSNNNNNSNLIQFLYLSACQQRMAYNRRALKVYITQARLRLVLEVD